MRASVFLCLIWFILMSGGTVRSAPVGATINFLGNANFPAATVKLTVTHPGQSTFTGSNGKLERGTPLFSTQVESGATFYRCDSVTGFPQRTGNNPPINRLGASSFIAVKQLPNGTNRIWINASVGAWRIVGGEFISDWEYQIRYHFDGTNETMTAGTIPNAGFYGEVPANGTAKVLYSLVTFKAEELSWDKKLGGLNFRFSAEGTLDPGTETMAALYWAKGNAWSDRLSDTPIFSFPIKGGFTGKSQPIHVPGAAPEAAASKLWNALDGTTHLLLAIDPTNSVSPSSAAKFKAIPDVQLDYGADVDRTRVSAWTLKALKDIYRVAGQKVGHINSLLRTPEEQALIMFKQSLDKSISSYGPGGNEVLAVYKEKTKGLKKAEILAKKAEIVSAMILKIEEVMKAGKKVSNHLANQCQQNAVDVGRNWITWNYGATGRLRFVEAACADYRLSRLGGPVPFEGCAEFKDPTYHLDYNLPNEISAACMASTPTQGRNPVRRASPAAPPLDAVPTVLECDLSSGSAVVRGNVGAERVSIPFQAMEGDLLEARIITLKTFADSESRDDDSMVFLFDEVGHLLASNDDHDVDTLAAAIEGFRIPATGAYTLVVTTFPNSPVVDGSGGSARWPDPGLSSILFEAEIFLIPEHPRLGIGHGSKGEPVLFWSEGALETASNVLGPWVLLDQAEAPHPISTGETQAFYRLRLQ